MRRDTLARRQAQVHVRLREAITSLVQGEDVVQPIHLSPRHVRDAATRNMLEQESLADSLEAILQKRGDWKEPVLPTFDSDIVEREDVGDETLNDLEGNAQPADEPVRGVTRRRTVEREAQEFDNPVTPGEEGTTNDQVKVTSSTPSQTDDAPAPTGERAADDTSVDDLDIAPKQREALKAAGLNTFADIRGASDDELNSVEGVGTSSAKRIREQVG